MAAALRDPIYCRIEAVVPSQRDLLSATPREARLIDGNQEKHHCKSITQQENPGNIMASSQRQTDRQGKDDQHRHHRSCEPLRSHDQ